MTFNILSLNISIKFHMIKNLFTRFPPLNLDFYLPLLLVPSDLSRTLSLSLSLHITARKNVKTRACH